MTSHLLSRLPTSTMMVLNYDIAVQTQRAKHQEKTMTANLTLLPRAVVPIIMKSLILRPKGYSEVCTLCCESGFKHLSMCVKWLR